MDIEKMTVRVQKSLNDAYSIAVKNHNQQLDVIHLFSALVNQEDGLIPNIFDKMNVSVDALKSSIDLELKKLPQIHGEGISSQGVTATRRINEALLKSSKIEQESQTLKHRVTIMKSRLRQTLEEEIAMLDDIDDIDY